MDELTHRLAEALRDLLNSPREGEMGEGTKLLCGELKLDYAKLALAEYKQRATKKVFVPRLGMVPEDSRGG